MCLKCVHHFKFTSQHDWVDMYDLLMSREIFNFLVMNKLSMYKLHSLWGKRLREQFGFANPLKLITCIISFKKGMQREKDMNNKRRSRAIVYSSWMWIVLEATISTTMTQGRLLLTAPQIVDLPLELGGGQLFLSLAIIDYAILFLQYGWN